MIMTQSTYSQRKLSNPSELEELSPSKRAKTSTTIEARKCTLAEGIETDAKQITMLQAILQAGTAAASPIATALSTLQKHLTQSQQKFHEIEKLEGIMKGLNTKKEALYKTEYDIKGKLDNIGKIYESIKAKLEHVIKAQTSLQETLRADSVYKEYIQLESNKLNQDLAQVKGLHKTKLQQHRAAEEKYEKILQSQTNRHILEGEKVILEAQLKALQNNNEVKGAKEKLTKDIAIKKIAIARVTSEEKLSPEEEQHLSSTYLKESVQSLIVASKLHATSVADLYSKPTLGDRDVQNYESRIQELNIEIKKYSAACTKANKDLESYKAEHQAITMQIDEYSQKLNSLLEKIALSDGMSMDTNPDYNYSPGDSGIHSPLSSGMDIAGNDGLFDFTE